MAPVPLQSAGARGPWPLYHCLWSPGPGAHGLCPSGRGPQRGGARGLCPSGRGPQRGGARGAVSLEELCSSTESPPLLIGPEGALIDRWLTRFNIPPSPAAAAAAAH